MIETLAVFREAKGTAQANIVWPPNWVAMLRRFVRLPLTALGEVQSPRDLLA